VQVPDGLRWWAATPEGAAWLERLPRLVEECAADWALEIGAPFGGHAAYVARARRADGERVVLKPNFPDHVDPERALRVESTPAHALAWGYEPRDRWIPWMVSVARRLSRSGR
jgi:hypothetical protein